jgi:hypothetical protein
MEGSESHMLEWGSVAGSSDRRRRSRGRERIPDFILEGEWQRTGRDGSIPKQSMWASVLVDGAKRGPDDSSLSAFGGAAAGSVARVSVSRGPGPGRTVGFAKLPVQVGVHDLWPEDQETRTRDSSWKRKGSGTGSVTRFEANGNRR